MKHSSNGTIYFFTPKCSKPHVRLARGPNQFKYAISGLGFIQYISEDVNLLLKMLWYLPRLSVDIVLRGESIIFLISL